MQFGFKYKIMQFLNKEGYQRVSNNIPKSEYGKKNVKSTTVQVQRCM